MTTLVVDGGYAAWRSQALRALAAGWPPESLTWVDAGAEARAAPAQIGLDYAQDVAAAHDIGDGAAPDTEDTEDTGGTHAPSPKVHISRELADLLQDAALFRSPQRWGLLYRVLWRWCQGEREVASAADEHGAQLYAMAKAVRRAKHDMIAYVRFRRGGAAGDDTASPEYVAWYEPDHDVLQYAAEHFARRMGATTWCIGTPHGAALWDGQALQYAPAPGNGASINTGADPVETLWRAYYRHIFNPARLNESALHQHMPVRFWKGLPEGDLIPAMVAEARSGARRVAQAHGIGVMPGKPIVMDAARAQPRRDVPSSLDQCRRCDLWRHATQAVPGQGPEDARIMLVGEQPGDHEDLSGKAFVGPAGQVLDTAMARANVLRDTVFLTNAVKHFKWTAQGKRRMHKTPGQLEVEACAHWLDHEIARVRPTVIVTLGATALNAVLHRRVRLRDYMTAPREIGGTWLIATWHPSYALRLRDNDAREDVVTAITDSLARAAALARRLHATSTASTVE
ncbi:MULTISPECIES: UdgX family uracil-DNA binding protein [unclassified Cupriavidus]|uniref:UdgX family uracil-DNA binding protein n=1 Tax=unclassified Cupriavidus TaxID=2640874 RepID=UPI001BFFFAE6|nr:MULTISPECIES: UdgX family uracil-DNA binding protein [unclassified Cupriavidus]MCA3187795.1 UdgX family uracil-DNA binding protein [Cupriavidus sp.]MCA3193793.1 UdgX family uracil-DNA binding protein [Cupriavidus sp.]MCA3196234.1 UdgX family uracil-DNA binding protein [Cupriavidus sp.]MCA3203755.1 UdgX family uracil-DNA binding protein [Cupriavidus sp.]MCA3205971.1 UdgX family uracil-DNA binding protein [Cupriavidus sp.]